MLLLKYKSFTGIIIKKANHISSNISNTSLFSAFSVPRNARSSKVFHLVLVKLLLPDVAESEAKSSVCRSCCREKWSALQMADHEDLQVSSATRMEFLL